MLPADPLDRIAALIMAKRRDTKLGVRAAALKAEINAATLSRLERRLAPNLPDSSTLQKLSKWLGVSLQELLGSPTTKQKNAPTPSTPDVFEVHLRADKKLSAEDAETLSRMFRLLYENTVNSKNKGHAD